MSNVLTFEKLNSLLNLCSKQYLETLLERYSIKNRSDFMMMFGENAVIPIQFLKITISIKPKLCKGIFYDNFYLLYCPYLLKFEYDWGAHNLPEGATGEDMVAQFSFLNDFKNQISIDIRFPIFRNDFIFNEWKKDNDIIDIKTSLADFESEKIACDFYNQKFLFNK